MALHPLEDHEVAGHGRARDCARVSGLMRSSSPWITSVGTDTAGRSCRRGCGPGGLAAAGAPPRSSTWRRARRIEPRFTLTAANAPLLASACVRLEGLPLAIELAAARLKVLTPGELVFRLGSRMDVLAGSTRDVPARQRALRNAIAWSYDLLNADERALFRGLSVFGGSWTLADAERVCARTGGDVLAGFLPTDPRADPREAELCTDYNADSIEKRERFPRLRDVSMFIGSWDELPDVPFGPGLPGIRPWSRRWFCSVPYVIPFNPAAYRDRAGLRRRLGQAQDHPLLVAAVGGTAVGVSLLELTCDAFGRLRKEMPDARMMLVTGPRIDPRLLPDLEGVDKRGYVPDLFEHLACADAAVVQGGLSTTMELVATGRPFVYFPLRRHWEQQHFVTHRLSRYRAGLRMDYATTTADDLAAAMRTALAQNGTGPGYRRVPRGGERRAAERIAALLAGG